MKTELVPGDDWSPWSRPYLQSESWFLSPSPRRYVQLEVRLLSEDPLVAPSLRSIRLSYSPPLVEHPLGEIAPSIVFAALPDTFSYFIHSISEPGNLGFDKIVIETPPQVGDMEFIQVKVDGVPLQVTADVAPHKLTVVLPKVIRRELVEIQFKATVFRNALFDAYVVNRKNPRGRQRVNPGDATGAADSQTTIVSVKVSKELIGKVSIAPRVITPNGDGINDEVMIDFTILKVSRPRYIWVTIYDLNGQKVKTLMNEPGRYGYYRIVWDGRDGSGKEVLPGVYVCQIKVDTDLKEAAYTGTVTVAY